MPVVEALATELDGKARFVKVEIDRDGVVLERFGSSGVPRYLLYRDGRKVDELWAGINWGFGWRLGRMLRGALD